MNTIISAYFTSKPDPQRFHSAPVNSLNYIYFWLLTSQALGLKTALAHDGLGSDLITALEGKQVHLHQHELTHWSTNDERFFAFELMLQYVNSEKVLITDCSDVLVRRDPFEFMREENLLYLGSDMPGVPRVRDSVWMIHKIFLLNSSLPTAQRFLKRSWLSRFWSNPKMIIGSGLYWRLQRKLVGVCFGRFGLRSRESIWDFPFVNPGVIGGRRDVVLSLVSRVAEVIRSCPTESNVNMAAVNFVLWRDGDRFFSGQPFTSPYKEFEYTGDYYVMHK